MKKQISLLILIATMQICDYAVIWLLTHLLNLIVIFKQ